ncbi:MAG: RNA 2',3'-cyclic phosphodiesterase [Thermoplasmataceae archaeon]
MRAFIAIEVERFPELNDLENYIRGMENVTPVKTETLHMTMFFLGNISSLATEEICGKLKKLEFQPTEISISGIGAFPNTQAANVLFLNVIENPEIRKAYRTLDEMPSIRVLLKQKNHFVPHITIARFKSPKNVQALVHRFAYISKKINVDHISLFKSTLTDKGPVYEEICRSGTS